MRPDLSLQVAPILTSNGGFRLRARTARPVVHWTTPTLALKQSVLLCSFAKHVHFDKYSYVSEKEYLYPTGASHQSTNSFLVPENGDTDNIRNVVHTLCVC
jgi:hypothetical protein